MIPEVDVMKCTGCGICIRTCPVGIIGLINKKASILRDLCEECGICAFTCPDVAILFELEDSTQSVTPYIAAFPTAKRLETTPGY
jgi:electron transfer flavoprotein alpha subunit